jgi:hypothetical protein
MDPLHKIDLAALLSEGRGKQGFGHLHYSRTSISGTVSSGRMLTSGRLSVLSDSFHRQNVHRLEGFSCKR